MVGIVARGVQNGYADDAAWINCLTGSASPLCQKHTHMSNLARMQRWQLLHVAFVSCISSRRRGRCQRTIRMPHVCNELHAWRSERVVLGKLELSGENTSLEGGSLGPLDKAFPVEKVVFRHRAGGDTFRRVVGESSVLLEEATMCSRLSHLCRGETRKGESTE